MMRKHWHAVALAVTVGVATTFAVGASSGPDSIEFWTGELLSLVMPHPLLGTMYWRLTEGVSVVIMALPGLVLALLAPLTSRSSRLFGDVVGRVVGAKRCVT